MFSEKGAAIFYFIVSTAAMLITAYAAWWSYEYFHLYAGIILTLILIQTIVVFVGSIFNLKKHLKKRR